MNHFEIAKCMCCNDTKHFHMLVHDSENIRNNVERLLLSFSINNHDFRTWKSKNRELNHLYLIQTDCKIPHFMCGYCYQVNLDSLKIAEDSLRNSLYKICYLIETEKSDKTKALVKNVLNLLSGHYPCTYRNLSNFYEKTNVK